MNENTCTGIAFGVNTFKRCSTIHTAIMLPPHTYTISESKDCTWLYISLTQCNSSPPHKHRSWLSCSDAVISTFRRRCAHNASFVPLRRLNNDDVMRCVVFVVLAAVCRCHNFGARAVYSSLWTRRPPIDRRRCLRCVFAFASQVRLAPRLRNREKLFGIFVARAYGTRSGLSRVTYMIRATWSFAPNTKRTYPVRLSTSECACVRNIKDANKLQLV